MPMHSLQSTAMKLRHAAALALVGWYLLMPPVVSGGGTIYADRSVPFSKWTIHGTYDTAQHCEAVKAQEVKAAKQKQGEAQSYAFEASYYSECVETDDPRLKSNAAQIFK
jgi:hypothetical protein